MFIPASGLELVKLESGTVGLIGTITSLMGLKTIWEATK